MSDYTYAGAMKIHTASSKFVTSLFKDAKGGYYTQVEKDEVIVDFKEIRVTRAIIDPLEVITVKKGDPVIYSFLTCMEENEEEQDMDAMFNFELVYGDRDKIEDPLLHLLDLNALTVHSRLIISLFLKLYQKTFDLIDASNDDLALNGVEQKIDKEKIFIEESFETYNHALDIHEAVNSRYRKCNKINRQIRLEDIVFMNNRKILFSRYEISIEHFINKRCLLEKDRNIMVSYLIQIYTENNVELLKVIINSYDEIYEFIRFSKYLIIKQDTIELSLSNKITPAQLQAGLSVLDIGIAVDKQIHNLPPTLEKENPDNKDNLESLYNSMQSITKQFRENI
ncbi:hypothetical protein GFS24_02240 [Chitinophaga sp. SYP-B3965]|uniref:hypothetical protein n=1 Tax=Chitinophaga sp. SYP-B3965 TaxID=2663120 RepID=UPI001299C97F|nr:hypothetical protein [Chitinophaga sp. SYP-B3965]MRG43912.1 hypothetical protein [Chitinophaga sp. SYP-B3965]